MVGSGRKVQNKNTFHSSLKQHFCNETISIIKHTNTLFCDVGIFDIMKIDIGPDLSVTSVHEEAVVEGKFINPYPINLSLI